VSFSFSFPRLPFGQVLKDFSLKEIFSGGVTLEERTGGILGRFCLRTAQANALFFYKRPLFKAKGVWEKNNFREAKIASWAKTRLSGARPPARRGK
jgi:hypothetical protein